MNGPESRSNLTAVAWSIAPGVLLAGVGGGIVFPILPVVGLRAGLAPLLIGLILAANRITRVAFNPWVGSFIDRFGGKRLMTIGLVVESMVMVMYWAALHSAWLGPLFLACRLVWGPASALILIGGQTLALNAGPASSRGAVTGIVRSAQSLGTPAGMVFGGIVAGWLGNGPAFLMGAVAALLAAGAAFWLIPDIRSHGTPPTRWRAIMASLADRRILAVVLINFVAFAAVQGLLLSTLVYLLDARHFRPDGLSLESTSGLALALLLGAGAISVLWAGHLSDRAQNRVHVVIVGLAVMIPGYIAIAEASQVWVLALGLVTVGVGMGMAGVPVLALIGDWVSGDRRGSAVGVLQLFGDLGGVLGPLLGTPIVLSVGARPSYWAMTGLIAAALVIALRLRPSGAPGIGR